MTDLELARAVPCRDVKGLGKNQRRILLLAKRFQSQFIVVPMTGSNQMTVLSLIGRQLVHRKNCNDVGENGFIFIKYTTTEDLSEKTP